MKRYQQQEHPTTRRKPLLWLRALMVALLVASGVAVMAAPAQADTGGYPYAGLNGPGTNPAGSFWADASGNGVNNATGYYYRNCTDYVAWKLRSLGVPDAKTRGLGNGGQWAANAGGRTGVSVSTTPTAGSAAIKVSTSGDPYGHVAFVEAVHSNGTITVSEYNWVVNGIPDGAFHRRTATPGSMGLSQFVNFGAATQTPPALTTSNRMSVVNAVGEVWAKDTLGFGGWAQQTGPDSAQSVSVGGTTQSLVDLCGAVWTKTTLNNGDWTQEAGCSSAQKVAVGSTGIRVILNSCNALWSKSAIGFGGWSQEAGCGAASSFSVGGSSIALVNGCGAIWTKPTINGNGGGWNEQTSCNSAKMVTISNNGFQVLVDLCDSVWAKNQITSGGWVQETSCGSAKSVSAGGNTQSLLDFCGAIYSKIGISGDGNWAQETSCDSAKSVVVGTTGRRVILSLDNAVWAKDGNVNYGGWGQQAGSSSAVAIAAG